MVFITDLFKLLVPAGVLAAIGSADLGVSPA